MFSVAFLRLFLVPSLLAYFILLLTYLYLLTYSFRWRTIESGEL